MGPIAGGKDRVTHQNAKANGHAGKLGGSVKDTSGGADLSRDAKNCIGGTKFTNKPLSPTSNAASKTNHGRN